MTTVVIAEDEAIIRLDLKETLESEGYEVVGDTGRGDHVLDLVEEHQPEVVIVDIKMPGLDGLEVAKQISNLHDAAVIVLTAFSQRDLVERAVEAGVLGYLVRAVRGSSASVRRASGAVWRTGQRGSRFCWRFSECTPC